MNGTTASGQAMPVGDLPGWHQVLADNFGTNVGRGSFATSPYTKRYYGYSGFPDTSRNGSYDPSRVMSVNNGVMDWYLHSENGQPYVESIVPKSPATNWGQVYGRFSVRFRSDQVPGYKLAFMLWPDSNKWSEGEVDFPEVGGLTTHDYIYANRYAAGRTNLAGDTAGFRTRIAAAGTGWHTATIEWSPNNLTYYLDGAKLGTSTTKIPSTSMHWVLQAETALHAPKPAANASGHLQVDWLTMYTRS
ncbi:glycoside hydrolase family 16 protein [Jatrophihabitans telluris]|uniref:Glycoside hydrolase family 16 protein n=1 Tax=Jatrophihabitans telluris TaxID=2038343 RepID=A0ABY4QW23_9ACTN|nr:glycoside hydrolase family 16 protein [Jatrophihabitans telluris]UQX87866.1 glycoside hydrolase family 16 protein [Jatrophihabitans telluris]